MKNRMAVNAIKKNRHAEDVVHGVVRVERDAVERMALLVLVSP